ncbi:cupin domain-containing protein [bacterium]|nr:cupin domain-containing protein [bacterium]
MKVINPALKAQQVKDYWNPKIIAQLNGQEVKVARLKGEFVWHSHANEDELFYVLKGELKIELRTETLALSAGEMVVIPRGIEHRPIAENEVEVLLFEPAGTRNTGEVENELTRHQLDSI